VRITFWISVINILFLAKKVSYKCGESTSSFFFALIISYILSVNLLKYLDSSSPQWFRQRPKIKKTDLKIFNLNLHSLSLKCPIFQFANRFSLETQRYILKIESKA